MKEQIFNPYLPLREYVPDAEPRIFGDRLYIFGSHDQFDGDFYCVNDYVCWSAPIDDLSNWNFEGQIYDKRQDPIFKKGPKNYFSKDGSKSTFAPDVVQGVDGRYYMYYGMDFINQTSVAVSDSPAGRYEYYGVVQHKDGTPVGQKENDPFQFDPAVLVDDDSQIYMYTSFSPHQELIDRFSKNDVATLDGNGNYVIKLDSDMKTAISDCIPLIPGWKNSEGTSFEGNEFYEASSIRKFNDTYYLIYSSIFSHELAYATSKYPDKNFEYQGPLLSNGDIGLNGERTARNYWGNNHGSIAFLNGEYYIFGHRQTNYHEFSRQGIAEKLKVNNDNKFEMAELTSQGLNGKPLKGKGNYPAAIACNLWGEKGAIKSEEVSLNNLENEHPCFTQDESDDDPNSRQYIHNIRKDTVIGFKYFNFDEFNSIRVKTRGNGIGKLYLYTDIADEIVASIDITPSEDWAVFDGVVSRTIKGVQPLFFIYKGEGMLDFIEFSIN